MLLHQHKGLGYEPNLYFLGKEVKMNDLIQENFTEKITQRINNHRNRFNRIIKSRYMEFLPFTIGYENTEYVNIDQL